MLKEKQILLLIVICSTRSLENIRVEYLPQNCTTVIQLLDLGTIRIMKTSNRNSS